MAFHADGLVVPGTLTLAQNWDSNVEVPLSELIICVIWGKSITSLILSFLSIIIMTTTS